MIVMWGKVGVTRAAKAGAGGRGAAQRLGVQQSRG